MSDSIFVLRQGDGIPGTSFFTDRASAESLARELGPTMKVVEYVPASIRDRIRKEIRLFAGAMRAELMLGNVGAACDGLQQLEDFLR